MLELGCAVLPQHTMKDIIDKATRAAEQELEDKEVEHLKNTIKNLLQRKKAKEKERDEIEREISLIKQDIEDFKKGRLDKIQERHEKDPSAAKASPIHITIINDNSRTVYPTQPWRWNYQVTWTSGLGQHIMNGTGNSVINQALMSSSIGSTQNALYSYNCSGMISSTFTAGTYNVGGQIIHLN